MLAPVVGGGVYQAAVRNKQIGVFSIHSIIKIESTLWVYRVAGLNSD